MQQCQPEPVLRAFSLGQLSDADLDAVADHLEACPACAAALEAMDGLTDLVVDTLRRDARLEPADEDTGPAGRPTPVPEGKILGPYRVVRQIGAGGMGVVYEAEHRDLGRRVALKVVRAAGGDGSAAERFRREARAAAKLHHTNIVPVFEVGEDGDTSYFAMQLIRGQSLDRVIARLRGDAADPSAPTAAGSAADHRMTDADFAAHLRRVATAGRQCAAALAHAHAHGIVHRDIKPANLLLDDEGTAWVTDFGLAMTEEEGLTKSGDLVGTLRYLAPERLLGECDHRADVYALGLTLYEFAALRPAFDSRDRIRLLEQIRLNAVEPLGRADPRIPRDLETIVHKACDREPGRRYATAADMADDLGRFLAGEPITARPLSRREKVARWARRNPLVAAAAVLIPAVLVAATAVSVAFAIKAEDRAREARDLRHKADVQSAELLLEAGVAKCQAGGVGDGLYTLLDAWRLAPPDAAELRLSIRRTAAAWRGQLPVLRAAIPVGDDAVAWYIGPAGERIAVRHGGGPKGDRRLVVRDAATGDQIGPARDLPPWTFLGDVQADPPLGVFTHEGTVWAEHLETGAVAGKKAAVPGLFPFNVRFTAVPNTVTVSRVAAAEQRYTPVAVDYMAGTAADGRLIANGRSYRVDAGADGRPVLVDFPDDRPRNAAGLAARFSAAPPTWGRLSADPSVAWDGRKFLSASGLDFTPAPRLHLRQPTIQWWDAATGRPAGEPLLPGLGVRAAGLTADGATLVTLNQDGQARCFDLSAGLQRGGDIPAPHMDHAVATRLALHPADGSLALPGRDGVLRVWATAGALPQRTTFGTPRDPVAEDRLPGPEYEAVEWGPGGRVAYLQQGPTLGRVVRGDGRPVGPPRDRGLGVTAVSPDGRVLATVIRSDWVKDEAVLRVTAVETGAPVIPAMKVRPFVHALAFSPDGRRLAVGCVGGTHVINLADGSERFLKEPGCAMRVAFSDDGARLAVAHHADWGTRGAGLRLWNAETGVPLTDYLPFPDTNRRNPVVVRYLPGGAVFTVCRDHSGFFGETIFQRHDPATGEPLGPPVTLPHLAHDVAVRPDGKVIAAAVVGGRVMQVNVETGAQAGPPLAHHQTVTHLEYSPDGQWLATAAEDRGVRRWEAATGRPVGPAWVQRSPVLGLRFDPADDALRIATRAGSLRTWAKLEDIPDDPDRVEQWIQATGGVTRGDDGDLRLLTLAERRAAVAATPSNPAASAHDALAADAEEDGEPRAALWHLNRLQATAPATWTTAARIGRVHTRLGDQANAAKAYDEAERLARAGGDTAALKTWHQHGAAVMRVMKDAAMEAFYRRRGGEKDQ